MDKKKIYIGIGILALVGGIYYYMQNKKKSATTEAGKVKSADATEDGASPSTDGKTVDGKSIPRIKNPNLNSSSTSSTDSSASSDSTAIALSKKDARKQSRSDKKTFKADCGKRPLSKKNRPMWQKCVDEQKLAQGSAFDGTKSGFS